ncbi:hypothetical protein DFH09DRAFT_1299862 [Mycena vulgaris]|nr:hypothetical protein DFH09DRAFT_1299862 [Mycena vulgaris]
MEATVHTTNGKLGRQLLNTLATLCKATTTFHQHEPLNAENLLEDPACTLLIRRLIADLAGVASVNPNILQYQRIRLKSSQIKQLDEYKIAQMLSNIATSRLLFDLRKLKGHLFDATVREAALASGEEVAKMENAPANMQLFANMHSRDNQTNVPLDRLVTSLHRLQQADGQHVGSVSEELHKDVSDSLQKFVTPALQLLLGDELLTVPYKTAASEPITIVHHIASIIEEAALDLTQTSTEVLPAIHQALALASKTNRATASFDFTELLDRFYRLKLFLVLCERMIGPKTCDKVMQVMTTAVYELEKTLKDLAWQAHSSAQSRLEQAEVFQELGTMLEALL